MKLATIYISLLAALIFTLCAYLPACAGNAPSEDIKMAGREGIKFQLKDARIDSVGRWMGFETQSEIDSAELGEGFEIFTIPLDKLLNESLSKDLPSLVTTTHQWEFLVVAAGKARALLPVFPADGKWMTGAVRSSNLSKEMSGFMATWPASAGYQYRFIRVYPISDFIELSRGGKVLGFFSLSSLSKVPGRAVGSYNARDMLNQEDVFSNLRSCAKKTMESYKTGGTPSEEIIKAARAGIDIFLKGRQSDRHFRDLGFEDQADLDTAELGEGFQIFTIHTDKLLDESHIQNLDSLVSPTRTWNFLIIAGGKAKSNLNVAFTDGIWESVGIGSSGFSKEIAGFLARWPASAGYHFRYIEMSQVSSRFIELSQGEKVLGLFDLSALTKKPGEIIGSYDPSDLKSPEEVLSRLRLSVRRNIEMWKQMNKKLELMPNYGWHWDSAPPLLR